MVIFIPMSDVPEVVHPGWLQKAGIRDFREWIMTADDSMMMVFARIGPGGNSGAPVRHENEEAAFVISGELVYEVEGREIKVPANAAIFIRAGEEHFVRNDSKRETALRLSIHTPKKEERR